MIDSQPYSQHKAKPIYADELEDISLKISQKTRELSDLYMEFNMKLAKHRKGVD